MQFGDKPPRVGDWVVAVGNPFGLGGTVTAGIVSARGRDIGSGPYDDYLQIDAPVNRGNSGGPTFDAAGQGSASTPRSIRRRAVRSSASPFRRGRQGGGRRLGQGASVSRGYIGVQIQPVSQEIADSIGLHKTTKARSSPRRSPGPAEDAGIKSGDVIVGGQRREGRDAARTRPQDRRHRPRQVDLTYLRGGSERPRK